MTTAEPQPSAGSTELELYLASVRKAFDRLCERLEGLSANQLNWRPDVEGANSIYVIGTHLLGNAEGWILGIACQQPIQRDRPAEFRSSGDSAGRLIGNARDLGRRIDEAARGISADALGEPRQAPSFLWGAGDPRTVTVREAFVHVIEHASNHLGHIDMTRDLMLAARV